MSERIEIRTLTDGGQQPAEIARAGRRVRRRRASAHSTSRSTTSTWARETAAIVGDAIRRAAERGVRVRFAYNVDHVEPDPGAAAAGAGRAADRQRCPSRAGRSPESPT